MNTDDSKEQPEAPTAVGSGVLLGWREEQKSMKCLNPNCDGKAQTRGICKKCYQSVRMIVAKKQITWAKLERLKKVLPIGKMGRPSGTAAWFTDGHINELELQETGEVSPPNAPHEPSRHDDARKTK